MTSRLALLESFVEDECIPAEPVFTREMAEIEARTGTRWEEVPAVLSRLKAKARSLGLWNLFMPKGHEGSANVPMQEYAQMSELMGRSSIAPEACNCSAPDTGNMEVFANYGSPEHKATWLKPLLEGKIRSAFLMTEPAVASSDATNIACDVRREGDMYVINGRKWWSSGAMDPRCKVAIVMCRHGGAEWDAKGSHGRHSMVVVPIDAPGVTMVRALKVFGYDDAPHGHAEVELRNVRVPLSSILLGEGRGFEIAQGRLGPGRVHHCMRAVGMAERALAAHVQRSRDRVAFGKALSEDSLVRHHVAQSRMDIDQSRLLVQDCAAKLEAFGLQGAIQEVSMIKVVVPNMACRVIDRAIQMHGGLGVCQDTFLSEAYAHMRTLRIADGPDEVHTRSVAKYEYRRAAGTALSSRL
ncbi:unnamed protein product [Ectocarpus sp. 12 AP-2014]